MHAFLLYLAIVTLLVWLVFGLDASLGSRTIRFLRDVAPLPEGSCPRVSVVIAARNEEQKVRAALRSVLAQDYPDLEVIVVNDRSTDGTGGILKEMARSHRRLVVETVTELPDGWLGKNHALQYGAQRASGEWLLFTDADVVMEPTTVRRALRYVTEHGRDHLPVAPQMMMPTTLLAMFAAGFIVFLSLYSRPWKARDPKSKASIGIGAFNLVRAEVYRSVSGHSAIAMRPDDDLKLGKLIKRHGYRQEMLNGRGLVAVEWYGSVGELVRGTEKNMFAGVNYHLSAVIGAAIMQGIMYLWPIAGICVAGGAVAVLDAAVVALIVAVFADSNRRCGFPIWYAFGFPVIVLLFQYLVWNATVTALRTGGIDWRGTHYPLSALRANRV